MTLEEFVIGCSDDKTVGRDVATSEEKELGTALSVYEVCLMVVMLPAPGVLAR